MSGYIEVSALNIAADPHPKGIYIAILTAAAGRVTSARGKDDAKITKPKPTADGNFVEGRILVWTRISIDDPWVNLESDDTLSDRDKREINIPKKAKPNYRVFSYVFDIARHRFYFESRNEFGESFGPSTAQRVIEKLIARGKPSTSVSVTVVPQAGAVEAILKRKDLRILDIKLVLPNPDEVDRTTQRELYERLKKQRARSLEQKLHKQAGKPGIVPDEETRQLAVVAAQNGFVRAETGRGKTADHFSTTDTPERKKVDKERGSTFFERLLVTRSFF